MKTKISQKTRFLQSTVYLLIIPFVIISCTNEPKMPTADEAKAAVMKKLTMAAEKWSTGEPMGYVESAADDIVWADELGAVKPIIGSENLKKYLESFRGQIPAHEFKLVDPIFQVYNDIVIVTYRYQGIFDGVPANPWQITSVYRYINGDWLSVLENWREVKQ
jgi:hypothetical protein